MLAVMTALSDVSDWLTDGLPGFLEQHDVPAAAVAVLADGQVIDRAAGVLSRRTGVEATTDSIFQIGSITKLWTSTLVMQLVDEGRIDLDATVRTYLPEFRIADDTAARTITVRQLLTHTAGFEGDIFTDTGVGDDCVEKYLGVLQEVPQLFPPGAMWSYNNAGFSVLGRLIEVLRGKPYDACLREYLIDPLGIEHAATGPYEAILHRAAVGHVQSSQDAPYEPTRVWTFARSNVAAGSMLAMSARALLAFARMHLEDGRAPGGTQLLAPGTAGRMLETQVDLPDLGFFANSWGLGFELFDTPGGQIVGHDGSTIGQEAFVRIVPDAGVAVALLCNGGRTLALYADVVGPIIDSLTSTTLPAFPTPPGDVVEGDVDRCLGVYSCDIADLEVSQDDAGRVWLDETPKGIAIELGDIASRTELVPYREDSLIAVHPDRGMHRVYAFLGDDGAGRARYLHTGRALVRSTS